MSSEQITIDDCIILGNAVPDEISDNRRTVCIAAFSKELGLIRIYPVPPHASLHRWDIVKLPLERNVKDNRRESWKVQGSKQEWNTLLNKIKILGKLKREEQIGLFNEMLAKYGVDCVEVLNKRKLSLGFIKPTILNYELTARKKYDSTVQMTLDGKEPFLTINNYDVQPRITYRCSQCISHKPHNQQIIEWGVYEWLRNNPDKKEQVWDNLRINDPNWTIEGFLVGNLFLYRNSFMVISIFRFKKDF